ncbi:aminotransferase class IV [Lyngbya aestuarii]|uniref:aminotransferase class IV n=1 Tax=Lyngbya aestuarii TaxID=118322 RepID=UPI00403E3062
MFWYNGQLKQTDTLELAIDEPGLLYGATVFTTLRVYQQSLDSSLSNWHLHCQRLELSLQSFGWQLPNWQQVRHGAQALSKAYPVLRITIFPDGREWITGRFLPTDLTQRQQQGITAWLADAPAYRRSLTAHKTGNYLSAWLALQASRQMGAAEAILVGATGNWLETSTGNLWGWQGDCWWTPPLIAGILPGVVRSQLIIWLNKQGLEVKEVAWDTKLVEKFEVIAYTNSVIEVIPIRTVLNSWEPLAYDAEHPSLEQLRSPFKMAHRK